MPDPPIATCNETIPLRILITKKNDTPATIYLQSLSISLIGYTQVRAHELRRQEGSHWVIASLANVHKPLSNTPSVDGSKVIEIDQQLWNQLALPNVVCPSFETCNITRHYEVEVKVGLSWGSSKHINVSWSIHFGFRCLHLTFTLGPSTFCPHTLAHFKPLPNSLNTLISLPSLFLADATKPELSVQPLRMPLEIYSGIAPTQAMLDQMANRRDRPTPPIRPSTGMPYTASNLRPPGPANTASPGTLRPPVQQPGSDHIEPSPSDIPEEAPPSYEDAMADELAPIDGPRRDYQASNHPPNNEGKQSSTNDRLFPESAG